MSKAVGNPFSDGAENYAKHRPKYPDELAKNLASLCPNNELAIEVGCGTGQFSHCLASQFEKVLATDLSVEQIKQAEPLNNITFKSEPAEKISANHNSASLIVAAQAAHWFDLNKFYKEATRVAVNEAIIALLSYGVLNVEGEADERFQRFYWQEIHSYWAPDRKHVETGYETFEFPFKELTLPPVKIVCQWNFNQLIGYIQTWSAMKALKQEGAEHIYNEFHKDMKAIWGEPEVTKTITWPISSRVGKIEL
jgi:ubiquinone/menaquinone biosynthesis C-methylase UbiE